MEVRPPGRRGAAVVKVGLLHPGSMGAAVGQEIIADVIWASEARSEDSRRRAMETGLTDVGTLRALCDRSDVVLSVCPPHAADTVAQQVADSGFDRLYVDANAVSPETARQIGSRFARFVDAGIVGSPPGGGKGPRIYLSGPEADVVADLFEGSAVTPVVIGEQPGQASFFKSAYAAWTKGSAALLLAVAALAESQGQLEALIEEWDYSMPGVSDRLERTAKRIGQKAWRFEGEMLEAISAFELAGLPGGFSQSSAEIYDRLAGLKDTEEAPDLESVLRLILGSHHPGQVGQ